MGFHEPKLLVDATRYFREQICRSNIAERGRLVDGLARRMTEGGEVAATAKTLRKTLRMINKIVESLTAVSTTRLHCSTGTDRGAHLVHGTEDYMASFALCAHSSICFSAASLAMP